MDTDGGGVEKLPIRKAVCRDLTWLTRPAEHDQEVVVLRVDRDGVWRPGRRIDRHPTEQQRLQWVRQIEHIDTACDVGERGDTVGVSDADDLGPVRRQAGVIGCPERQVRRGFRIANGKAAEEEACDGGDTNPDLGCHIRLQ